MDGSIEIPPNDVTAKLSREDAARALGVSVRSVGRLVESGDLQVTHDDRGRPWFDHDEVERLALARSRQVRREPGELAARAFELFASGLGPRDVVTAERVTPDVAAELHVRWVQLGRNVVIDGARAERLAAALGLRELDVEQLERVVSALPRVARALYAPCSSCGTEQVVGQARYYSPDWVCRTCHTAAQSVADE